VTAFLTGIVCGVVGSNIGEALYDDKGFVIGALIGAAFAVGITYAMAGAP